MEVVGEVVFGAPQRVHAVDLQLRTADTGNVRAHQAQDHTELMRMRLAGGVTERRAAMRRDSAEREVLGRRDGRVVQPVVAGGEAPGRPDSHRTGRRLVRGSEGSEHVEVRIDLAHPQRAASDVVLEPNATEAVQQGRHQHDCRMHAGRQARLAGAEWAAVLEPQRAAGKVHVDRGAQRAEELEQLAHVSDVGHPVQHDRFVGEQGGA